MLTKEFLELLSQNGKKELLFEYQKNQFVPKAYHITEVKNLHFDSVDCGGNSHQEDQTIVQLWSSGMEFKTHHMKAQKALEILEKVDQVIPMKRDTNIYFEYGNKNLATSNYQVEQVINDEDKIIIKMSVPAVACKPKLNLSSIGEAIKCC